MTLDYCECNNFIPVLCPQCGSDKIIGELGGSKIICLNCFSKYDMRLEI